MRALAAGCLEQGWRFVVAGDRKSPPVYDLAGCRFLSVDDQRASGFALARVAPEGSYTRKNLAYLEALRGGAEVIVETDDDNHPEAGFWMPRQERVHCRRVVGDGWVNAYRYFTDGFIYPRGLPLTAARDEVPQPMPPERVDCPVQQGLADVDPDVDAVYRMLYPLPFRFQRGTDPVALTDGAWCPFNSQNTTFFPAAFPLMYLPAHCNFRMTDIWRSFVVQRVLQAKGAGLLFHEATVWQERNVHDLQRDFADEMPGYLHNAAMRDALMALDFKPDDSTRAMVECCYELLMRKGWVGAGEEGLLAAWFGDLAEMGY
jgi:hypothetical protein